MALIDGHDYEVRIVDEGGAAPWFYPVISPILTLAADGMERIWVTRRAASDPERPGPIDLLTAAGAYLGTLDNPGGACPVAFGPDGLVAFFERGAFDAPVLRVERL